jgi:peptidoglycan-associated lipoprotein
MSIDRIEKMLIMLLLVFASSCSSLKKKSPEIEKNDNSKASDISNNGMSFKLNDDSDSNKAGALKTVYFDFNSAGLSQDTKDALNNNAQFLKTNASVKVQVEGHADERGGDQFNLALGEKRAKGVREFLSGLGIDANRITTISLGKEKPVAFGHDEESWGKNRRANFVIIGM